MDVEPVSGRLAIGFDQSHLLVIASAHTAASASAGATTDIAADTSTAAAHAYPHDESVFALSADWHLRPVSGVDMSSHGPSDAALCLTYSCEDGQLHLRELRTGALLLR